MDTLTARAAAVTGARHARAHRNGQDASAVWLADGVAVVVVCDGCSAGAGSELGARLGAALFARAIGSRLGNGESPSCRAPWCAARTEVIGLIAELLDRMPGQRDQLIRDHFLFTIVAAAATRDSAAVWVLGDGAYSFGTVTHMIGPFEDNQPPYLAYDLLGDPRDEHFDIGPPDTIVIATDGASEVGNLERFAADRFADHPDALRRELAVLARGSERIDWDERRVVRMPALLQDDCAVGIVRWRTS